MARSDYVTPDLLEAWQLYAVQNIWKFNQVLGDGVTNSRFQVWVQPERDMVGRTLTSAYEQMREALYYPIRPEFVTDEFVHIPDPKKALCDQLLYTRFGYLQGFGTRAVTALESGASITYSDVDGDTVDDTGTVTVTTAVDPSEIQIFFRVADGAPEAANALWRIPAYVTSDGAQATITFHRANCVKPTIWAQPYAAPNYLPDNKNTASTANTADFITSVDVYRVYRDSTDAVQVMRFTGTNGAPEYTTVTATVTDSKTGEFVVTGSGTYADGSIVASYEAGYPLTNQKIDTELLTATIRLANANMPLAAQSASNEPLVAQVWEEDRKVYENAFNENTRFGQMVGHIAAAEVVTRRAKYVGGYAP